MREDAIGEKIYAIYPYDPAMLPYVPYLCDEVLLADFNVQAGNQIEVYSKWPGLSKRLVTVDDVGSILIDGEYRKKVNVKDEYFSYNYPPDIWVEGMGSIVYGLFYPSPEAVADLGGCPEFLCMHINSELLYQNPEYDVCYKEWEQPWGFDWELYEALIQECIDETGRSFCACEFASYTLNKDEFIERLELLDKIVADCTIKNSGRNEWECECYYGHGGWPYDIPLINGEISIYPNPASNRIFIKTTNNAVLENSIIEIYDIQGRKQLSQQGDNLGSIGVSSLKTGCYLMKIMRENENIIYLKLIKR